SKEGGADGFVCRANASQLLQRGDGLASKPVPALTPGGYVEWKSSRRAMKTGRDACALLYSQLRERVSAIHPAFPFPSERVRKYSRLLRAAGAAQAAWWNGTEPDRPFCQHGRPERHRLHRQRCGRWRGGRFLAL